MVAHVISKIWEKNLLPLQERVENLLKSVEADAIILYKVLRLTLLVSWIGQLSQPQKDYPALPKRTDFCSSGLDSERDSF